MPNLKIDIAAEFTGKKAFKQAEGGLGGLQKLAGKAGGALAAAFSVQKVVEFGKASIDAFMEDEKAASRLAKVVDNLGLGFENANIADFIDKLTLATGVSDNELRPAFQALLTTTGSVTKSQELLKQALDISAGSGVDLATVSEDLSNAYLGNVKGLKKYNLGMTAAELKAASFEDIMKKLNGQFQGSQAAELETYAGKMQLLKNAAGEAQEKIGKALVDAISHVVGGTEGVQGLADSFNTLAEDVSNVVYALTKVYDAWKKLHDSIPSWMNKLNKVLNPIVMQFDAIIKALEFISKWGGDQKAKDTYVNATDLAGSIDYDAAAKRAKAEKDAARRAKELARLKAKELADAKKAALLKKQNSIFDLEQIELVAALKGKLSDDERKRAELQLALLQGNETLAAKLTKELADSIDNTGKLAKYLSTLPDAKNPFGSWQAYLDAIEAQAKRIAAANYGTAAASGNSVTPPTDQKAPGSFMDTPGYNAGHDLPVIPPTNAQKYGSFMDTPGYNAGHAAISNANYTPTINVQIDGKTVVNAILDQGLNGNQAYINRTQGGFV